MLLVYISVHVEFFHLELEQSGYNLFKEVAALLDDL
jgi:hypothetical protein